jgi:hypothetical protein
MVTHEAEMAAYARTVIHFRDGIIGSIKARGPHSEQRETVDSRAP